MSSLLPYTIVGLVAGCIYAVTASGLVVTYTTTGIFNFAHGAIGMIAAFTYWQLTSAWHWPQALAVAAVLLVMAPVLGALIERVLMRSLRGSTLDASVTTTLGLLLFLIALASLLWNPAVGRAVPGFFVGNTVTIFGIVVTAHQLIVVGVAVAVAILLRIFLYRTRAGTALRAVVDDAGLAELTGASTGRFGQLGWMIGAMLAALAGVLLASLVTLDITNLTLLVINGYAAAMLGRLRSLPLTFVGGLLLGLIESYVVGYLPVGSLLTSVKPIVPMVFLFVVLVALPQRRLDTTKSSLRTPRIPRLPEAAIAGGGVVLITYIVSRLLSDTNVQIASHGMALALVMLSVVLLTGYGGQVSLCQMTFAGVGAFAMGKVSGGGSWLGILLAIAVSGAVGMIVALPALRLRGLYLALGTLAFADAMDFAFFQNTKAFGVSDSIDVNRVGLPGISLSGDRAYLVFLSVAFAVIGFGLVALRRSRFGRRLAALADSPPASATIGMNLTRTKLAVFAASAALAGLAGALYGGQQRIAGPSDFQLLLSLTILLLAVVWGIRTISGMLFAGLTAAIAPQVQAHVHALRDVLYLAVGLAAVGIGRHPNGVFGGDTPLQRRRDRKASEVARAAALAEGEESRATVRVEADALG
jgi:branched-chain amino acid transport system permease protein